MAPSTCTPAELKSTRDQEFQSTPNGFRTRAATLKGWTDFWSGLSESTDQRLVLTNLADACFTLGVLWALALSTECSALADSRRPQNLCCALLSTSVLPSPLIDSRPPSRPLIARIKSSKGPATVGPSPALQYVSVASTLRPLNSFCPGKNRLDQRSLATRIYRLSGTFRFSFNGRRMSNE